MGSVNLGGEHGNGYGCGTSTPSGRCYFDGYGNGDTPCSGSPNCKGYDWYSGLDDGSGFGYGRGVGQGELECIGRDYEH